MSDAVGDALRSLDALAAPLAFLLLAVPFAAALADLGVFDAAAARIDRSRHLELGCWVVGALVTTFLNLDAAVVLLTPLYARIARRHGLDPLGLAVQPVLLALCASSALPVSNLTNLLAVERLGLSTAAVVAHLAPVSLVATCVGYAAWRRCFPTRPTGGSGDVIVVPAGWRRGVPAVAVLVAGVTVGDAFGIPAWAAAAAALTLATVAGGRIGWASVPWRAALLTILLGFAVGVVAPSLHLERWLHGAAGPAGVVVTAVGAALAANLVNNLPALLAMLPALVDAPGERVWAVLVGVNAGPVLLASGTLASLLWLGAARAAGVEVSARDFSRIGVRVGLPAFAAGTATLVLAVALGG